MTKTITIKNLVPGQEVSIWGCRENAQVVCRVAKNLYRVNWQGRAIEVRRAMLGVMHLGQFRFGAVNATEVQS